MRVWAYNTIYVTYAKGHLFYITHKEQLYLHDNLMFGNTLRKSIRDCAMHMNTRADQSHSTAKFVIMSYYVNYIKCWQSLLSNLVND